MNPLNMMKLKDRLGIFQSQHPRIAPFLQAVRGDMQTPGTVLELKIQNPEGKESVANIRLTKEDVETIQMLFSK